MYGTCRVCTKALLYVYYVGFSADQVVSSAHRAGGPGLPYRPEGGASRLHTSLCHCAYNLLQVCADVLVGSTGC